MFCKLDRQGVRHGYNALRSGVLVLENTEIGVKQLVGFTDRELKAQPIASWRKLCGVESALC